MPVVGVMPYLSSAPASTSGVRRLLAPSQGGFPWWKVAVGGGSGRSSSNKLGLWWLNLRLATLFLLTVTAAPVAGEMGAGDGKHHRFDVVPAFLWKDSLRCVLQTGVHHGGGDGVEDEWSSWCRRLGRGSSSSTQLPELRRPSVSSGNDGRWAVSVAPSVTLLVEGRHPER